MMKIVTLSILIASIFFSAGEVAAATGEVQPDSGSVTVDPFKSGTFGQDPGLPGKTAFTYRKNNVKMNLSSLVLNNYSFSYERSLTRKISVVAGYRFMPETVIGSMALTQKLVENLDVSSDVRNNLDNFTTSNKAYTGEVRFYSGKKPGARGLYVSLYGRYTDMRYDIDVEYDYDEKHYDIPIRSEVAGIGGGLMLGSQWLIAKRVVFDWYIIGGHYGKLTKGNIVAIADIDPKHHAEIKEELEALGTVGSTRYIEANVNNDGVQATVSGPFFGVRGAGFSLGLAF